MIRTLFLAASNASAPPFANGIQPAPSLVLGHNYENSINDVTGSFPLGFSSGSPAYANNWAAQGFGLTNFNFGGLKYFVDTGINTTFETGTYTFAMHLRTGASVATFSTYLIGDGSTFNGVFVRNNGGALSVTVNGASVFIVNLTANTNYHIAVTATPTLTTAWLDGSNVGSSNLGTPAAGGTQYKIGDGDMPADWAIYDYGVWNIAMNSTQINNIRNNLAP